MPNQFNHVIKPQLNLTNMIILTSLHCHSIEIYFHHSNIILLSFWCHFIIQDLTQLFWWNEPGMINVVVAGSFCFRTSGNDWGSSFDGMTGMRLERPSVFAERGPNGDKRGSNDSWWPILQNFIPVIRTSFLIRRSFWIIRERIKLLEWPPKEVKTRRGVGKKSGDFPHRKPSFLLHSTLISTQPEILRIWETQAT